MNNLEAKFILHAYRPNGADATDETFAAALEQAARDPALHAWLGREQAFDARMSGKLAQVTPPAGLREAILAGGRVTAARQLPARPTGRAMWMGLAASLAVAGVIGLALWPKDGVATEAFSEFALADATTAGTHGGHGEAAGALQGLLGQPETRLGNALPVDFEKLRSSGCRRLTFEGREVFEVCFSRNGVWFHCYIARRSDLVGTEAAAGVTILDDSGLSLAKWADAQTIYVVVSKKGRAALEALL